MGNVLNTRGVTLDSPSPPYSLPVRDLLLRSPSCLGRLPRLARLRNQALPPLLAWSAFDPRVYLTGRQLDLLSIPVRYPRTRAMNQASLLL